MSYEKHYPDHWVVLKITVNEETLYKVLCGWHGGYLDNDYWRINSGITRVVEENNYFEFYGSSGSCYVCRKDAYRLSARTTGGIYSQLIEQFGDAVQLIPEDTNWLEIEYG